MANATAVVGVTLKTAEAQQAMNEFSGKIKKDFTEMARSVEGLRKQRQNAVNQSMHDLKDSMEKTQKEILAIQERLQDTNLQMTEKKELESLQKVAGVRLKGMEQQWGKELEIAQRRKRLMEETAKDWGEKMGGAAQNFGDAMQNVFSNLTTTGGFSGLTAALASAAKGTKTVHERASMGAQGGGAMGGMSKAIAKLTGVLGPALTAIAGLAAGFAAVAKIIIDTDAQAKELNKTIIESGIVGGDLAKNFRGVKQSLADIRQAFTDAFSFNRLWGTTAKDHLEILGAYQSAGLTMENLKKQFHGVVEEQEKFRKATELSLGYSKLFGLSSTEAATNFASYMENMGFTLEGVGKRFSAILSVARESGFGVKRFYSTVSQATSGMSLYNVRIHEAVGLLNDLGKTLGRDNAGSYLQSLMQGFKGESTQDSIKAVKKMGLRTSLRVSQADARASSREFLSKVGDWRATAGEDDQQVKWFMDVLNKTGFGGDSKALVTSLSKMNTKQRNRMAAELGAHNAELARMFRSLGDVSQAERGNLAGAVTARAESGPAAKLLSDLYSTLGVLKQRLDQVDDQALEKYIASEHLSGKQAEDLRMARKLGGDYGAQHDLIQEVQARVRAETDANEKRRIAKEYNEQHAKAYGVSLDDSGARYRTTYGKDGSLDFTHQVEDTFDDFIMSKGHELEGQGGEAISEDLKMAQMVAKNTTEITKILSQGVEVLLEKIWRVVEYIKNFFGLGDKEQQTAKAKAQDSLNVQILEQKRRIKESEDLASGMAEKLKGTKDPEERKKLEAGIKRQGSVLEGQIKLLGVMDKQSETLADLDMDTEWGGKTLEGIHGGALRSPQAWLTSSSMIAGTASEMAEIARQHSGDSGLQERIDDAVIQAENRQFELSGMGYDTSKVLGFFESTESKALQVAGHALSQEFTKVADLQEELNKSFSDSTDANKSSIDDQTKDLIESDKAIADEDRRLAKDAKTQDMARLLMGGLGVADPDVALSLASQISAGDYSGLGGYQVKNSRVAEALMFAGVPIDMMSSMEATPLEDGFISAGGRLARISEGDHVLAFKDNGPVSKALGNKGVTINAAFSGIGPRDTLAVLNNALKTGMLRAG